MALPEGFSEFEFLQDLTRRWHNRVVREEFRSLGGADWEPDISLSEGAVRHACTIKDTDTAEMVNMRMMLFYFLYGKAKSLQPPIYGIPSTDFKEEREFNSQIYLFFAQDPRFAPEGRRPIRAEFKIKLTEPIEEATWQTELERLARRIKQEFGPGHPTYTWQKGKDLHTYLDPAKGYPLHVYAYQKTEAVELIKKLLAIQNHVYNEDYLTEHIPTRKSVNNPSGTTLRFGKRIKKPRWRPHLIVRFRYAVLLDKQADLDIILCDATGELPHALERI